MMFLVSEVHPFADGNGRVARLMMNSELVARAEVRITIPTVYRNNYLAALRGVTHTRNFAGLAATLDFARRYTARSDFSVARPRRPSWCAPTRSFRRTKPTKPASDYSCPDGSAAYRRDVTRRPSRG